MSEFVPGQRWVVDSEPELGLGIVVGIDARAVTLAFPQVDCERLYAVKNAPLTRIIFDEGDEVELNDGSTGVVTAVHSQGGLLIYDIGGEQLAPETMLSSEIKMKQPLMRLLTGQLDKPRWFAFRRQFDAAQVRLWQSKLAGLLGVRASLIAHQLYVAAAACDREKVRVLLADEVGLGKTIEAGMILSRMLKFDRVGRALVLVPDALQVQWLVELIRRFNLRPELFQGEGHAFDLGQIHLVPHSALPSLAQFGSALDFDMVIVDEAHHIGPQTGAFGILSALAEACEHMVLLSATPEQLGVDSHFARLQLLDSAKFDDFGKFLEQEKEYSKLNDQIKSLPDSRADLITQYQLDDSLSDDQIIDYLLDCHGIGRVMFRNTRSAVAGFPSRFANPHPIENDDWETKFEWLAQFAKANAKEKLLVICHEAETVKDCENYLWDEHGKDVSVFHEGMDLIERDRAAAYFADMEHGSQILLCSEIGSEGRNFQFSHHLVCLDLPQHPDLLEQRIGRLDRIGQSQDVQIHIPFCEGSPSARQFHWFNDALNCIAQQNPAAPAVHDIFYADFENGDNDEEIIAQAKQKCEELQKEIQQGRDALLERNSCRQPLANDWVDAIAAFEEETPLALVETASDLFNFHFEETHAGAYSLIPADNMLIPALPSVPPEGLEITFDRSVANGREDVVFVSWDSPFITGLWELLHQSDLGSASVALLASKQLPAGQCLLETNFDILVQSPLATECWSFLDDLSLRILVLDISDKDLSAALPEESLDKSISSVEKKLARKIIQSRKEQIPQWFHKAEAFADQQLEQVIQNAQDKAKFYFAREVGRLESLAEKNPNVSQEEIIALKEKAVDVNRALGERIQLSLSAIRLIVTTAPEQG